MNEMGWKMPISFEESLKKTIQWTLDNQKWLEEL
jgi:dTDP-D-glucose 4,6-dehydratase